MLIFKQYLKKTVSIKLFIWVYKNECKGVEEEMHNNCTVKTFQGTV